MIQRRRRRRLRNDTGRRKMTTTTAATTTAAAAAAPIRSAMVVVVLPRHDYPDSGSREEKVVETSTSASTVPNKFKSGPSDEKTYDTTPRRGGILRKLKRRQKRKRPEEEEEVVVRPPRTRDGGRITRYGRSRYGRSRITRKNTRTWTGIFVVAVAAAAAAAAATLLILDVQVATVDTRRLPLLLLGVEGSTAPTTPYGRHGEEEDDDDDHDDVHLDDNVHSDSTPQQQEQHQGHEHDVKSYHVRRSGGTLRTKTGGGRGGSAVDEDGSLHDRQNQQLDDTYGEIEMDEIEDYDDYYYNYDNEDDNEDDNDENENDKFRQEISGDGTIEGNGSKEWQQLLASQIPQLPQNLFSRPHRRSLLTWGQTGPNTFQISFGGGAVASTPSSDDDYGIGKSHHPSTRKHSKKGGGDGSDKQKPSRRPTRAPTRRPTRPPTRLPTRPPQRVPTSPPRGGGGPNPPHVPTAVPTDRPPVLPPIIIQPIHPPTEPPVSQPTQPPSPGGGGIPSEDFCLAPIKLDFLQFSSIPPAIVPFPTDPNPQDLGTRYVYNNALKDGATLGNLPGSTSKGVCTRTQARIVHSNNNVVQLGGGVCDFTYTFAVSEGGTINNNEQPRVFSITVSGYIEDVSGGTLSVTGGTADAIGAIGQVQLVPVNLGPNNSGGTPTFVHEDGDVFVDPFFYLAELTLFLPCSN